MFERRAMDARAFFSDQNGYRFDLKKCNKTRIETWLTSALSKIKITSRFLFLLQFWIPKNHFIFAG